MKHIICGLVSVLLGVWGIIVWWFDFGAVMRGLIPFALLAIGIIGIIAGLQTQQASDEKDTTTEKATQAE